MHSSLVRTKRRLVGGPTGRYLRVNGTMRCTVYGYSIWEMRAYGDANANCEP
jgi:hypothetical protein